MRNVRKISVRKPEGKRPRGRPKHKWEDNIRIDFREIGLEGVDWIYLERDQWQSLVNMIMNLEIP
jgi:hypothetical protein